MQSFVQLGLMLLVVVWRLVERGREASIEDATAARIARYLDAYDYSEAASEVRAGLWRGH